MSFQPIQPAQHVFEFASEIQWEPIDLQEGFGEWTKIGGDIVLNINGLNKLKLSLKEISKK